MPAPVTALFEQLLWPVLIPGSFATLLLLLAWRPWQRGPEAERGASAAWAMPVALGLGVTVAFVSQEWPVQWPPPQAWQDFLPLGLAAMAAGLLASAVRSPVGATVVGAAAVAAVAGWLMELPTISDQRSRLILAGAIAVLAVVHEALGSRRPGMVTPAAWWMTFTALSIAGLKSGNAKFSLIAAGVSAVCGGAVVVGLVQPYFRMTRGAMATITGISMVMLAANWIYLGEETLGPIPWVLIAAIPLAAWLGELPIFSTLRKPAGEVADGAPPVLTGRRRLATDLARLSLPALFMVAAIGLTLMKTSSDGDSGEDGSDGPPPSSIYGG